MQILRRLVPLVCFLGLAAAQFTPNSLTPAGSEIQNQATATFVDSQGQPQTVPSNPVITVVTQVYDIVIIPNGSVGTPAAANTKYGPANTEVEFNYNIFNNGNGEDTIALTLAQDTTLDDFNDVNGITIYHDVGCDGLDSNDPVITSITLDQNESTCLAVLFTLNSSTNGDDGRLNLIGTSENAVEVDNDNWAMGVVTNTAAFQPEKEATPTVNPGGTITFTITGSNSGASPAFSVSTVAAGLNGILISDLIPSGLLLTGTPSGTSGAGTITVVYSSDNGSTWTTTPPGAGTFVGNGSRRVGWVIVNANHATTPAFFPVNAQFSLTFTAQVPAHAANATPATAGTQYQNNAQVFFSANNDGDAGDPGENPSTNTTTTTVNTLRDVAVGPWEQPLGGAAANYIYDGRTISRPGSDLQTIAVAGSGNTIRYRNTLRNTGNASDSFILSLDSIDMPSGTTCTLKTTALSTLPSPVGPLAAGADYDFVVECTLPTNAAVDSDGNTTTWDVIVTAMSVGNNAETDTTTDRLLDINDGYTVDVAHNTNGASGGEAAEPTNDLRTTPVIAVNPGAVVNIPFEVQNTGTNVDNYNLSTPLLPFGASGAIYPDSNCDGTADAGALPVTSTGALNPSEIACFVLAVSIPSNSGPISADDTVALANVQITASSITVGSGATDTIYRAIDVNLVTLIDLQADRSATLPAGNSVVYDFFLTNNYNVSVFDCALTFTASSQPLWTYEYSTTSASGPWSPTPPTFSPLTAAQQVQFWVRVQTHPTSPPASFDNRNLTATCDFVSGGGLVAPTVADTVNVRTTIVGGELTLVKSAIVATIANPSLGANGCDLGDVGVVNCTGATAAPGQFIIYTIVATNIGAGVLTNLQIADALPSFVNFTSVSASASFAGTVIYSTNGGTSWSATAPVTLPFGNAFVVGVDTNSTTTITAADTVPAGGIITITFVVQVQ